MNRERITNEIIEKNRYSNRRKEQESLDFCPCINHGKKCHNLPDDELICFTCYCPYYTLDAISPEGNCLMDNPQGKGKWYYDKNLPTKNRRIWDCSDCDYMHTENGIRRFLEQINKKQLTSILEFSLKDLMRMFYKKLS